MARNILLNSYHGSIAPIYDGREGRSGFITENQASTCKKKLCGARGVNKCCPCHPVTGHYGPQFVHPFVHRRGDDVVIKIFGEKPGMEIEPYSLVEGLDPADTKAAIKEFEGEDYYIESMLYQFTTPIDEDMSSPMVRRDVDNRWARWIDMFLDHETMGRISLMAKAHKHQFPGHAPDWFWPQGVGR